MTMAPNSCVNAEMEDSTFETAADLVKRLVIIIVAGFYRGCVPKTPRHFGIRKFFCVLSGWLSPDSSYVPIRERLKSNEPPARADISDSVNASEIRGASLRIGVEFGLDCISDRGKLHRGGMTC